MRDVDVMDEWCRNKTVRRHLVPWVMNIRRWTYFATVEPCPAYPLKREKFEALLHQWDAWVCRKLYGPRWLKTGRSDRPLSMVFFEGGPKSGTLHTHGLIFVPPDIKENYALVAEEQWNKLTENKTVGRVLWLQPVNDTEKDRNRVTSYATKNLAAPENFENWLILPP
jgi:hypothetical protein